jgi:His/Glu/Gln/Arg/opine family amino acid ABC transporter permease subunit
VHLALPLYLLLGGIIVSDFLQFSFKIVIPRLLEGMQVTLLLTAVATFFGILIGLLLAIARVVRNPVLGALAQTYITLFRGTPLVLQILVTHFGIVPAMGLTPKPFLSVAVAMSLNAGAYIAEIIRAAIQSIDKGQMEAARSLGMSYGLAMRRVILPQTFRRVLPPLVNEVVALTKDTSLAFAVGLVEFLQTARQIVSTTFKVSTYFWTAIGYLIITMALTAVANRLERQLEAKE